MVSVLDIVTYPAEILRAPTYPVSMVDNNLQQQIEAMFKTMYKAGGVGLAAPQIGQSQRLFVLDPQTEQDPIGPQVFINPVMVQREGVQHYEEGCLSLPDTLVEVTRAAWVKVAAINFAGDPFEIELEGFPAVIFQHELDHLDGILICDYLSNMRLRQFVKEHGEDRYRWKYGRHQRVTTERL